MLFAQRLRPDQVIRTGVTEPFGIRQESPVRVAQGIVPAFVAQARAAGPLGPTSQPAAYGSSVHIQAAAARGGLTPAAALGMQMQAQQMLKH